MTMTIVCPHCGTIIDVAEASVARCDNCKNPYRPLYTCHIDKHTMTLCLECLQRIQWNAGPSERKTAS